jgi:metal-responsive CopG/Arc/MetJ family transcriptional regulator
MQSQKISISLPPEMVVFLDHYQNSTGCRSRSQVISEALQLLRLRELEEAYTSNVHNLRFIKALKS